MRSVCFILLATLCITAQGQEPSPDAASKFKTLSMLPEGSELQRVMLPRYDKNHKLSSVLTVGSMTLVNANQFAGRDVVIEFFDNEQKPSGRIDFKEADYFQDKGTLVARHPVELKSERVNATGEGVYYSIGDGRVFLTGKVVTIFKPEPKPQL